MWPKKPKKCGQWPKIFGHLQKIEAKKCKLAKKSGQLAGFWPKKWPQKTLNFRRLLAFLAKNPLFSLISVKKKIKYLYKYDGKTGLLAKKGFFRQFLRSF